MNKQNEILAGKLIFVLVLYLFFARPVLRKLSQITGQSDTPEKKKVDAVLLSPPAPFDENYWRNNLYQQGTPPNGRKQITVTMFKGLEAIAARIYKAMGYATDWEADIFAAFGLLRTQSECSYLAFLFKQNYGLDLLTYLNVGKNLLPQNGLSDLDLLKIINTVKKLPA